MKYDDVSWYEVFWDEDEESNPFPGSTHIGMFFAWAESRNLLSERHTRDFREDLEILRSRSKTPGAWFMDYCDGKLTDGDLSQEGNLFAKNYYEKDDRKGLIPVRYFTDCANTFPEKESIYDIPDSWENFDRIVPII